MLAWSEVKRDGLELMIEIAVEEADRKSVV